MTKVYNSQDQRVDYSSDRAVWRDGVLVYKQDKARLGDAWRSKMEKILEVWDLPAFHSFIDYGYATYYINGTDLHGNKAFEMDGSRLTTVLNHFQKVQVEVIFESARLTGQLLGYTLGDITCGNMMTDGDFVYLIDYEVITPWPLNQSYITIWEGTQRIVSKEI